MLFQSGGIYGLCVCWGGGLYMGECMCCLISTIQRHVPCNCNYCSPNFAHVLC